MPIADRRVKASVRRMAGMARCFVRLAVASSALAFAGGGLGVRAEPLATEACDALKPEHAALEAAGLPATIKKGAAWGKANLSAAKLKEVERYIGLEEQMLFRCGLARLRVLPGAEGEETGDPDKPTDKPATENAAPAAAVAPVPQPKPKAKPKTVVKEPVAKEAAPAAEAVEVEPKPQPKAKPKPKPKADDAFKPPPAVKE